MYYINISGLWYFRLTIGLSERDPHHNLWSVCSLKNQHEKGSTPSENKTAICYTYPISPTAAIYIAFDCVIDRVDVCFGLTEIHQNSVLPGQARHVFQRRPERHGELRQFLGGEAPHACLCGFDGPEWQWTSLVAALARIIGGTVVPKCRPAIGYFFFFFVALPDLLASPIRQPGFSRRGC